ncbi:leucyl aminopeptidase [Luteimonas yindakuii]|uniref:leucyl aminopeptidase n=1 Tax=Luteimonas yindakuii TaxID=2565782 RepID=UPI0011079823|nr:leucyl aminopeptidase [Luteimonas yindakuii]QCO67501.2 leucyl aminopeptidase [Luteimonas yindakuii]
MFRSPPLQRLLLALFLSCLALPAAAQREIRFDAYAVPSGGTIALAMRGEGAQGGAFAEVDAATGGALARAVAAAGYKGRAETQLDLPGLAPFDRVLVVGMGSDAATARTLEDVGGRVGRFAAGSTANSVELLWQGDEPAAAQQLAFGAALGGYRFDRYRSQREDDNGPRAGAGTLVVRSRDGAAAAQAFQRDWAPVANGVKFARDLVTEPASAVYPEEFVRRTRQAFSGMRGVTIEVLDVPAMQRLGMGGILAVGQGSARPPRLLVVRYDGAGRGEAPVAFVGKGITFDSGGLSIKGSDGMWRMKYDMAGAASSVGAVLGLAGRGAAVNAVAVAALAENMPSGTATRPGDVIRTASGKTFEVMSTDAEGRMVLVDAIWYVQDRHQPRAIIDIATLTGSIVTALGGDYAGLFSRDDSLAGQLLAAGEASGDALWRMPMHPGYGKMLESPIADLRNGGGRPGSGTAAHFIGEWVGKGTPWAHVDIAGMAWIETGGTATTPAGATAFGVRLFDRWVRDHVETQSAP